MASVKTLRLQEYRQKLLNRLPDAVKAAAKQANQKNAEEFAGLVRLTVPKGEDEGGHLVDSLTIGPAQNTDAHGISHDSSTGVRVSIGDAAHPYPMHLEGGHRTKSGTHVPAKPFWNPSKRVTAKRSKSRTSRAINKAIKAAVQ